MLKEFSFRNCRSFKEESLLSMEANPALKDNFNFVIQRGAGKRPVYLNPLAAIYGSNAGGKTNLLRALADAIGNIYIGLGYFRNIPYMHHKNDFMHKLTIVIKSIEYQYEYNICEDEVVKESLKTRDIDKNSNFKPVFIREGDSIKEAAYKANNPMRGFLETMALNKNSLIMKMAGEIGLDIFADFYQWCGKVVIEMRDLGEEKRISSINSYAARLHADRKGTRELESFKNFVIKFDPSISDVTIMYDKPDSKKKQGDSDIKRDARLIMWQKSEKNIVPFLITAMSNGTKKLIELYPPIKKALEEGSLFVCDELETLLHPLIFKNIVNMFNDPVLNPNGAQLIFSAHNTIVMNRECLRRDEVHFVDKDEHGKSSIFRLSDVVDEDNNKIRMDARYDRLYLDGYFGATPESFHNASATVGGR